MRYEREREKECGLGLSIVFKLLFIYLFLEKGEGGEKERERNINVWLPLAHLPLGTWPAAQACARDWELNQQPFGLQAGIQSTEPHQPGLNSLFLFNGHIFWGQQYSKAHFDI